MKNGIDVEPYKMWHSKHRSVESWWIDQKFSVTKVRIASIVLSMTQKTNGMITQTNKKLETCEGITDISDHSWSPPPPTIPFWRFELLALTNKSKLWVAIIGVINSYLCLISYLVFTKLYINKYLCTYMEVMEL